MAKDPTKPTEPTSDEELWRVAVRTLLQAIADSAKAGDADKSATLAQALVCVCDAYATPVD